MQQKIDTSFSECFHVIFSPLKPTQVFASKQSIFLLTRFHKYQCEARCGGIYLQSQPEEANVGES